METPQIIHPIGVIRSALTQTADAPLQGDEGGYDAWLEMHPEFAPALEGINIGDELIILTWLHLANRAVLQVHPRGDSERPVMGVFATRSQDRPNPIGLHRVSVVGIDGTRLNVTPLEAVDGTPIVDIKPVLSQIAER